jgi:NADPH-dependent 2,4-dienoyl-CoA reductase/sulfur reductase-like enzyme
MAERRVVVVGASLAAVSVAERLRERGSSAVITLVGDEGVLPYDRPPLSKQLLAPGPVQTATAQLRPPEWYDEQGITLRLGTRAVSLHPDLPEVELQDGERLTADDVVIATGARARRVPAWGEPPGLHYLRTLADSAALARTLAAAPGRLVVVGGGFIGLEIAAGARALGAGVTVVEATDRLLSRAVTPTLSEFVREAHERRGTRILLGASAVRVHGDGSRASGVELADGTTLSADVVVVGIGVLPRTELAERLGLLVEPQGIVVDAQARTSDGVTVAAGDCTVGPNPFTRGLPGPTRLESVPHATDQARAAAATLAGHPTAYVQVPWFWSDQGDLRLQMAGLPAGADRVVVRGDVAAERFSVLSYREGVLLAVESVDSSADYVAVKRALEKGMTIDADAATDAAVPLKRLITGAHAAPSS